MIKFKQKKCVELFTLVLIYSILIINAIILKDSLTALISAFCGITYTIMAGKGNPFCYFIGILGSGFYAYLSFKNALWGNLLLYLGYYIPMQILGFFRWSKHLKKDKNEIIKSSLGRKELIVIVILNIILIIFTAFCLMLLDGRSPIIDSITTILSVTGMYLTVRRSIEQWVVWMIVNAFSFLMWFRIVLQGGRTYSTMIMWAVYFFLAIYFYAQWKKEVVPALKSASNV